jgi:hypothetical protein
MLEVYRSDDTIARSMEKLIRCRGCPRCGSRKFIGVARDFEWGTWNECRECRQQYKPAPSLVTAIGAIMLGSLFLTGATFMFPAVTALTDPVGVYTLIMGLGGLLMIFLAILSIVRYTRTPRGPLEDVSGFPVITDPDRRD